MSVGIVTGAAQGMGRACATRMVDLVDALILVDRDEVRLAQAADELAGLGGRAQMDPFLLDIADGEGVTRLGARAAELGQLRAVAHVAGVSPTMADWRQVMTIDLVATALLAETFLSLATTGTAMACFASIAPHLVPGDVDPAIDAALDAPLDPDFLERIHAAAGPGVEDSGFAYMWAKRGVHRLVRRDAVRFGQVGARICSVSPGIIDTAMGRQEAAAYPTNDMLVQHTPLGREGQPDEVAAAAVFLLSEEASFVNGIDLLVDGGCLAALRQ